MAEMIVTVGGMRLHLLDGDNTNIGVRRVAMLYKNKD